MLHRQCMSDALNVTHNSVWGLFGHWHHGTDAMMQASRNQHRGAGIMVPALLYRSHDTGTTVSASGHEKTRHTSLNMHSDSKDEQRVRGQEVNVTMMRTHRDGQRYCHRNRTAEQTLKRAGSKLATGESHCEDRSRQRQATNLCFGLGLGDKVAPNSDLRPEESLRHHRHWDAEQVTHLLCH